MGMPSNVDLFIVGNWQLHDKQQKNNDNLSEYRAVTTTATEYIVLQA